MRRVVAITGASDGIGGETARQLAANEGAGLVRRPCPYACLDVEWSRYPAGLDMYR